MDFRPVPKPVTKPKEKPKYKERRPKKKKKPIVLHGRAVPTKKQRTKISKTNYERMIEEFGETCMICNQTPIEAHHIVFRSHFGSGNWRNLAPLCKSCHTKAHKQREFADLLKDMRIERFGPHFAKDVYSLYKEGLVKNTTDKAYLEFMRREEVKACAQVCDRNSI